MVIQHLMASMNASNNLKKTNRSVAKSTQCLSSGYKINSAADDAAGLAISEKMRAQIRGLDRAHDNVQDGISMVQTADGALEQVTQELQRIRELSVMAANGILTDEDRFQTQQEVEQLKMDIDRLTDDTEFNTIKLFRPEREDHPLLWDNMDIVFCVDATGSMSGMITAVKNNIEGFVEALRARNIDVKLGLVVYRDIYADKDALEVNSYFNSTSEFKEKLEDMAKHVSGGGDLEESGLEAIMEGAIGMEGRPDATRHCVLVTDAPVHTANGSGFSKYTIDEVADALTSADMGLTVVGSTNYMSDLGHPKKLADKVGGVCLDVSKDFSEGLLKVAGDFATSGMIRQWNRLQTGSNAGVEMRFPVYNICCKSLKIKDISVETQDKASKAISQMDIAIGKVNSFRGEYGAIQNRLEYTANNLTNASLNLTASESTIRDTDMAEESAQFAYVQILMQAGQSMLAQANQTPQNVLRLLEES